MDILITLGRATTRDHTGNLEWTCHDEPWTHRLVEFAVVKNARLLVLLGDAVGVARAVLGREVHAANLLLVDGRLVGALDSRPLDELAFC